MGCKCSKERTRKLATAESRRKHLASHPLIIQRGEEIPSTIEVIKEYVDTGHGHVISTACFRSKSKDIELKGMICYCQGYSSFIDWTDTDCAINFVKRGYIFITHDHYGHGRSDGVWLTNPTSSYNTYVDDAIYIFERAKRKYTPKQYIQKNKKFHYYLLGHSLGGAVAIETSNRYTSSSYYLNVCKRINSNNDIQQKTNNIEYEMDEKSPLKQKMNIIYNEHKNDYIPETLLNSYCNGDMDINTNIEQDTLYGWDGLILSAPMVKIKDEMKPPSFIVKIGGYLVPLMPDARIVPTKSMIDKLTRDEEYFQFVQKSPLMYDDRPTLRTAFVLLNFSNHIEKEMEKVRLPILIMHGEKDQITDPEMSQLLYDQCSSKEKKIRIFDGAFHALLIDSCRNEVFDEVDHWIIERNKMTKLW